MAAFLELHVAGGGLALVEIGMIGAVMASGVDAWRLGTPEKPVRVVLRAGDTLDVIGMSAGGVVWRMHEASTLQKAQKAERGLDIFVHWMGDQDEVAKDVASSRD